MTELFIIELFVGPKHTFTTAVSKLAYINATIRPRVWTTAKVSHWTKSARVNSAKCGWVLRSETPWR